MGKAAEGCHWQARLVWRGRGPLELLPWRPRPRGLRGARARTPPVRACSPRAPRRGGARRRCEPPAPLRALRLPLALQVLAAAALQALGLPLGPPLGLHLGLLLGPGLARRSAGAAFAVGLRVSPPLAAS